MIITTTKLARRLACQSGLDWFRETYPRGLDTENDRHLARWFDHKRKDFEGAHTHPLSRKWICDLIVIIATERFFTEARSSVQSDEPLLQELADYIRAPCVDFWYQLASLPKERLLLCLRQVARRGSCS
jgi:hypothetical protein